MPEQEDGRKRPLYKYSRPMFALTLHARAHASGAAYHISIYAVMATNPDANLNGGRQRPKLQLAEPQMSAARLVSAHRVRLLTPRCCVLPSAHLKACAPVFSSSRTQVRQLGTSTEDIFRQPHPTPRPESIAYFTGNPRYYQDLMTMNALIRKHDLSFQVEHSRKTARPRWMSENEMSELLEYKLTPATYRGVINKLNILFVKQEDKEISKFLNKFVKPGQSLIAKVSERPQLDEHGRSYTYGSRKTARAQVWMVEGDGKIYVNGTHISEYFAEDVDREAIVRPLEIAKSVSKYNVWAVVSGGGQSGQAAAVAVGVARGLTVHDPLLEEPFKASGMLKIDTRQVERKKTGQPGARKKYTWVKR
ncbi:ribosomal protein S9/S16-domain-containing protein [Phlyctochytrium arcticum]|nr:ribosomal protein S9/S16-domain-containing protein [Phlyctochytrium arcticum]